MSCYFDASGSVLGCMCVYTHTHTHTAHWVLDVSPGVGTRHLGGPEESRWTKSRQMCIRICVQSTHGYIYAVRRDRSGLTSFFLYIFFSFEKEKQKM